MPWRVLLMVPVAAAVLGCGDKYPVKGKVQFRDGTPLTAGVVIFTDEQGASSGYGSVGPDGSFEITYDKPRDGLPKGTYRVTVMPPSPWGLTEEQKKTAPPRWGIALKYLSPDTSEILVTIDGKRTDLVLELERDKGTARRISPKVGSP
ncbi:MAG: carboxypeptidase-like regulatory domain-containing protein [Gemmataceae bacterium]|nr:carboxypeptidase-like regulatory domain-containing protein [Gemmataceae bacterium]